MQHTIALPAVMTADTVVQAQASLLHSMRLLPNGAQVVLDASGVQSFDSAGLALLLACRRAAHQHEQTLTVQGWTASLESLAQVYGVMPLLDPALAAQTP